MEDDPNPPPTHIALRGDYRHEGVEVEPANRHLSGPGRACAPNRLEFARWLVAPENPLVARVAVNRLWQEMFGQGIVATSEDFGTQGDQPSHPELLDYLATDFATTAGVTKRCREIALSRRTGRPPMRGPI